jgi:AcrR family transcriptional regulator
MSAPLTRKMRRDAEANLGRLVVAAESVFAERGLGTCIELVAERAGVGIGTFYRRIDNKRALIAELANRGLRR